MTSVRKRITIVAGVGAFIVLAVVALNWRQVYYWFVPEARFWGTWEIVEPDLGPQTTAFLEFRDDDFATLDVQSRNLAGSDTPEPFSTYKVTTGQIAFSHQSSVQVALSVDGEIDVLLNVATIFPEELQPPIVADASCDILAAYEFRSDDDVMLQFESVGPFGTQRVILRRLPETGDADK